MNLSIQSGELITALAQAQSEFPVLNQDKAGYNYSYLTLANILNELRPILGKNGVVFTQGSKLDVRDGMPFVVVDSLLMHKAEWMSTEIAYPLGDIPKGMTEIQWVGSIISYLRRYGALGILGIAGAEKEIEDIQSDIKAENIKLKG